MQVKRFILSLLLLPVAYAATAEDLACTYDRALKGNASQGASAKISIEHDRITYLEVESSFSTGQEGGGYTCSLDTSSSNQSDKWVRKDKQTLIHLADLTERPTDIAITRTSEGYRLNLEGASHDYCGAGASWPKYIDIIKGSEKCKVKFNN